MLAALLFSGPVPFLIAAAALLAPLLWQRLRGGRLAGAAWGAVALGLAYAVAHPGIRGGVPDLPPTDVTDWPWALAPAAMLLGVLEVWRGAVVPLRWAARLALVAAGLLLVAGPSLRHADAPGGWLVVFLAGLLVTIHLAGLDALAERPAEPPGLLALAVAVAGSAGVVLLARSAVLAQLCGALAAALAALLLFAWRQPALTPLRGAVPVLGLLHGLLVVCAYLYAYLPAPAGALLALTPWAAWVSRRGPLRRLPPWGSLALAGSGILLLVGAAALLARSSSPAPYDPY